MFREDGEHIADNKSPVFSVYRRYEVMHAGSGAVPPLTFICRVVELEQEKLDLQSKNARIVVGKDGKVYEQ